MFHSLFPQTLFCQGQHQRVNYKFSELVWWQLHPHHHFAPAAFPPRCDKHPCSHTTEMDPWHLRRSVKSQKQTVLLAIIRSNLLPCLGWGRMQDPHLNSITCHSVIRPDLQHRSEMALLHALRSFRQNLVEKPKTCGTLLLSEVVCPHYLASQALPMQSRRCSDTPCNLQ